jgi:hypothetical protein
MLRRRRGLSPRLQLHQLRRWRPALSARMLKRSVVSRSRKRTNWTRRAWLTFVIDPGCLFFTAATRAFFHTISGSMMSV